MNRPDPIDLIMLGAGWAQGAGEHGDRLSVRIAVELEIAAELLDRLWREDYGDPGSWDGPCWAYEVAEPLGMWLGRRFAENCAKGVRDVCGNIKVPDIEEIEEAARELIEEALRNA